MIFVLCQSFILWSLKHLVFHSCFSLRCMVLNFRALATAVIKAFWTHYVFIEWSGKINALSLNGFQYELLDISDERQRFILPQSLSKFMTFTTASLVFTLKVRVVSQTAFSFPVNLCFFIMRSYYNIFTSGIAGVRFDVLRKYSKRYFSIILWSSIGVTKMTKPFIWCFMIKTERNHL